MARNSFKELERLELDHASGPAPQIRENMENNIGLMSYVGKIVELFIPKVFQVFITMAGGRGEDMDNIDTGKQRGHSGWRDDVAPKGDPHSDNPIR